MSLATLKGIFTRPRSPEQSTDFAYARFLTPWLAGSDVSIFLDSDMLCLTDIWELYEWAKANPYMDVLVRKHDYQSSVTTKFLGQKQTNYPCKNWSSLMVFNGHRSAVRRLTPQYVGTASGMELHQFKWSDAVGDLPIEFNHLVGEFPPNSGAKIVHYTLGSPCFRQYQGCEFSNEWFEELSRMTHCDDPILEWTQCLPTSTPLTKSKTTT